MSTAQANSRSTPLLVNKNILIRDSIFKRLDLQNHYACEEKARESLIYQQLQRKLEHAQICHQAAITSLDQQINALDAHLHSQSAAIHQQKIELWELKNEVMQLQEMIEQDEGEFDEQAEDEEEELEQGEREYEEEPAEVHSQTSEADEDAPLELSQLLARWGCSGGV